MGFVKLDSKSWTLNLNNHHETRSKDTIHSIHDLHPSCSHLNHSLNHHQTERNPMTPCEALESYINGNISYVRSWLHESGMPLWELLQLYIDDYSPSDNEIVRFVKSLER